MKILKESKTLLVKGFDFDKNETDEIKAARFEKLYDNYKELKEREEFGVLNEIAASEAEIKVRNRISNKVLQELYYLIYKPQKMPFLTF